METALKRILKEQGLTQDWLAFVLGLSQPNVNRWANGRVLPRHSRAEQIARVLGLPVETVFPDGIAPEPGALEAYGRSAMEYKWRGQTPLAVKMSRDSRSVAELARAADIHIRLLVKLASGKGTPTFLTAVKLGRFFDCHVGELFPDGSRGKKAEYWLELALRRANGQTLREIGNRFGITRERVRQIIGRIEPLPPAV